MHEAPHIQPKKSHFPFWLSILVTDVIMFCNVSFYGVYMCEVYICNLNLCCKLFPQAYPKPKASWRNFLVLFHWHRDRCRRPDRMCIFIGSCGKILNYY